MGTLEFSNGKADITEVSKCAGDVSFFLFYLLLGKTQKVNQSEQDIFLYFQIILKVNYGF